MTIACAGDPGCESVCYCNPYIVPGTASAQTWAWNGAWRVLDAGTGGDGGARLNAKVATDPVTGELLLAGGINADHVPTQNFVKLGLSDEWVPVLFDGGPLATSLVSVGSAPQLGAIAAVEQTSYYTPPVAWFLKANEWTRGPDVPAVPTSNWVFDPLARRLIFTSLESSQSTNQVAWSWVDSFHMEAGPPMPLFDETLDSSTLLTVDTHRQRLIASPRPAFIRTNSGWLPFADTSNRLVYDEERDVLVGDQGAIFSPRQGQPALSFSAQIPADLRRAGQPIAASITVVAGAHGWAEARTRAGVELLPGFEGGFGLANRQFLNDAPVEQPQALTAVLDHASVFRQFEPGAPSWSALVMPRGANGDSFATMFVNSAEIRLRYQLPAP
jgi:hypothetical protein